MELLLQCLPGGLGRFRWQPEPFFRRMLSRLALKLWKPEFHRFDQIPLTGACLLVANHVSYVDGLVIAAGCQRPVRFVIDGEIYKLPIVHYIMKHNRAIPILPNRESVSQALDLIAEGLAAGDAICIFPEGQLTYTGSLGRFRPGIEWIIQRTPVTVYPIALVGLWGSVFSRKYRKSRLRWLPRRLDRKVVALCGDPIPALEIQVNHLQRVILRLKQQAAAYSASDGSSGCSGSPGVTGSATGSLPCSRP